MNKLTVPQLKEFLKCQGLKTPSKAKKENFVQMVVDHVTSGKLKKELLPQATADDIFIIVYFILFFGLPGLLSLIVLLGFSLFFLFFCSLFFLFFCSFVLLFF